MELVDALVITRNLMDKWQLYDWLFAFNQEKILAGLCIWEPNQRIELSAPIVLKNNPEIIKSIALHEIAHALAGREGEYDHGPKWVEKCRLVGVQPVINDVNIIHPAGVWEARCSRCKMRTVLEKRPLKTIAYSCPSCLFSAPALLFKRTS